MPQGTCALCYEKDDLRKLIAACKCYKKNDDALVHQTCLKKLFSENQNDEAPRCRRCHEEYHVRVEYKFAFLWTRCLTCRSLSHIFEFLLVILMLVCGGITLTAVRRSPQAQREQEADKRAMMVIYFLFALTLCLFPLTLRKVYQRWKKANAEPEISVV